MFRSMLSSTVSEAICGSFLFLWVPGERFPSEVSGNSREKASHDGLGGSGERFGSRKWADCG